MSREMDMRFWREQTFENVLKGPWALASEDGRYSGPVCRPALLDRCCLTA
jgi:hypothetical protein